MTAKRFKKTLNGHKVDISALQQVALKRATWSEDEAKAELGRNAKLVLNGLVTQGLAFNKGSARWVRSAMGSKVLALLAPKKNGKK